MATPPKPWKTEYTKSGRSSCKTCKNPSHKEILRLGKMIQATQFDGFMPDYGVNKDSHKKNKVKDPKSRLAPR